MSIAAGWNPHELYPCLYITDLEENLQYTFESESVKAGAVQNFIMMPNWSMHIGTNEDPGFFEFYIQDNNKQLINQLTGKAQSKIKRGWNIQVFMAKPGASPVLKRWFYGTIITADVIRSQTGFAIHRIYCAQWGYRKKRRLSRIQAIQKKQTDGTTPDTTDNNAKASEVLKRMVARKTFSVLPGLAIEPQMYISNMELYLTYEEDVKDQSGKLNNGTMNPALKDGATEDKTKGYTATTKTTLVGSVYAIRYTGLDPSDEISHVGIDISTAAGNIRVKIYDDNAGAPNNLLAESGSVAASGTGVQYIALTSRAVIPSNGIIHAAFECDNNSLVIKQTTGLTSGTTKTVTHTYGAGPNPFGAATNQTYGLNINIRIVYRLPNYPDFVNGIVGMCGSFNGAKVIELANESNFDFERTDKFNWAGYRYFDALGNTETLFAKWQTTTPRGILIQKTSANKIRVIISNTATTNEIQVTTSNTVSATTWYHIVVTYDGSSTAAGVKIYIDSVLQSTTLDTNNLSATILNNKVATIAGRDNGAGSYTDYFTGDADEDRIYKVNVLSQYQINALFAVPFRTTEVQDIDVKIEGFRGRHNTFEFLCAKLVALTAAYIGLDQDRKLYMRTPNQVDSGFRFTNDKTSSITTSWDQNKIGFFKEEGALSLSDSIRTGGDSVLVGIGASEASLDINLNPTHDALFDLSANNLAIQFKPNEPSINKLAFKVRRRGAEFDTTEPLTVTIVDSIGGTGAPDTVDIISFKIPADRLNLLDTKTPDWLEFNFAKRQLIPDRTYYVVFDKHGSASKKLEIAYLSSSGGGTGTYYAATSKAAWGGSNTGTFALRTYPTTAIQFIMLNNAAAREFGINEKVVNLAGIPTLDTAASVMFGLSPIAGQERRLYPPIKIEPPYDPIPVGTYCSIFESFLNLGTKAMILAYDLQGDIKTGGGCNEIEIQLEEYVTA